MPAQKVSSTKTNASRKMLWFIPLIIFVVAFTALYRWYSIKTAIWPQPIAHPVLSTDFGNQTITLNNEKLTFAHGLYTSATGQHTALLVNATTNGLGTKSAAILIDYPGASGIFYYVIGASSINGHIVYSSPVFFGDRIKIVSVNVLNPGEHDNGLITVLYLDRAKNAFMATEPTQQMKATYAFQDDGNLIKVLH